MQKLKPFSKEVNPEEIILKLKAMIKIVEEKKWV